MLRRRAVERADTTPRTVWSQAVTRFVWWTLAAVVVCSLGAVLAVKAIAADIAIRDASMRGGSFARNVAAPLVNEGVRAGDPVRTSVLETIIRNRRSDGSMVRVKIWADDGTIIWSDAPALNGELFELDAADAALLGSTQVTASISDLAKEENDHERLFEELLEVYAGAYDANGRPVLVESYWSTARITQDEVAIFSRVMPLTVGVLVLLMLAIVPLALSLARRVDRAQSDRSAMLRHALAASDLERRRISRELHDGLIQDLTSLGYALPSVAAQLPPDAVAARQILESVRSGLQLDISSLRSLLADLYPSNLAEDGLAAAVDLLVIPLREKGLRVDVRVDSTLEGAPAETVQLAYRIVREGLRNILKHATDATEATVTAAVQGDDVRVTVTDDGAGSEVVLAGEGHLGIRLLQDDIGDIGGWLTLRRLGRGGAQLAAQYPVHFDWAWVH